MPLQNETAPVILHIPLEAVAISEQNVYRNHPHWLHLSPDRHDPVQVAVQPHQHLVVCAHGLRLGGGTLRLNVPPAFPPGALRSPSLNSDLRIWRLEMQEKTPLPLTCRTKACLPSLRPVRIRVLHLRVHAPHPVSQIAVGTHFLARSAAGLRRGCE